MKINKKYKIVISGYYGYDNLGDEAILYSLIKNIKKKLPDAEITVLSGNVEETKKKYNVNAVDRFKLPGIIKELSGSSVFVSGGGGLLQDITGFKTLQYYLGLILLAKLMFKPVMVYAQGIGPINTKLGKFLIPVILNQVNLITVRDQNSKDTLAKLKVKKPPITVTADAAFSLDAPVKNNKTEKIMKIGISARPWNTKINYVSILANVADHLIETHKAKIYLLPFQERQDYKTCEDILSQMKNKAEVAENLKLPEEMLEFINRLDFLIAMRLHALIFAAICQVPLIGISYDPKVKSFLDFLEHKCINLEELNACLLINGFKNLSADYDISRKKLREKSDILKEKANINNLLLAKLVQNNLDI